MRKEFEIPVDDHLLKWASIEFWNGMKPPFKIDERSLFGKLVYGLIIDKRQIQGNDVSNCDSILCIELSETLAKRSPDLLRLSKINYLLDEMFKESIETWTKAEIYYGASRYQAVINFFKYYNLDQDKMIKRYCQYIQRKNASEYIKAKSLDF